MRVRRGFLSTKSRTKPGSSDLSPDFLVTQSSVLRTPPDLTPNLPEQASFRISSVGSYTQSYTLHTTHYTAHSVNLSKRKVNRTDGARAKGQGSQSFGAGIRTLPFAKVRRWRDPTRFARNDRDALLPHHIQKETDSGHLGLDQAYYYAIIIRALLLLYRLSPRRGDAPSGHVLQR